jgi:hypothetical protein
MRPKRPAIVLVIAILNFLGAGLTLLLFAYYFAATRGTTSQPPRGESEDPDEAALIRTQPRESVNSVPARIEKELDGPLGFFFSLEAPHHAVARVVEAAVSLILSGILIASGVGLLAMKTWGRRLSILYALLGLLNHVICLVYFFAVLMPALDNLRKEMLELPMERDPLFQNLDTVLAWFWLCPRLTLIYPFVVFIVMVMPSVTTAFGQADAAISSSVISAGTTETICQRDAAADNEPKMPGESPTEQLPPEEQIGDAN